MNKQPRMSSWTCITIGAAMLVLLGLYFSIWLAAQIGLGKAVGAIVFALSIAVWLVIALVLLVEGMSGLWGKP